MRAGFAGIERVQRRRVRSMVAHAYRNVPYYRETMRRLGLTPAEFLTARDLAKLPVIERETLQRDPEAFLDERRRADECIEFRSGGSSGRPISIQADLRDLMEKGSAVNRIRPAIAALGVRAYRSRTARLAPPASSGGLVLGTISSTNLLKRIYPRTQELRLAFGEDSATLLAALHDFGPDVISGYGSHAEELFAAALRGEGPVPAPKVFVYASDALPESARALLADEFGIPVLGVYGAVETPQIAFECEHHMGMHQNADLCPIRLLGPDGEEVAPGVSGEVVTSNLVCRTTVLLNYRLGDLASWTGEACPCGRALPLLSLSVGRTGQWATGLDGRRIPGQVLARPLSLDPEVWGYRVEQLAPGRFRAAAIKAPGAGEDEVRARVVARFAELVGGAESLDVEFVSALPRTTQGKINRLG